MGIYDLMEAMGSFLGVVAGALVSFLGVILTLRRNQKIHETNIEEERRKAKEYREYSSKQNALIAASEAVSRFIAYYLSMVDRILPVDGTVAGEVTEMSVALNRLHFFCSLETIEKLTWLSGVLSESFTKVMIAKMASAFINEDLNVIDSQVLSLEKMNLSIQEEIKAILQSGCQDPLVINHRQQLAQNYHEISDLQGRKVELIKQKYIETEKCRDVLSQNIKPIYEALRDVLLLARQELSFPIEQERYKQIIDKQIELTVRQLEGFLVEIRKQVSEKIQ